MRESDRILAEDLREAGLEHLAQRAEAGEWNDFFGEHASPQINLVQTLRDEIKLANPVRKRLIENVVNGKYDAGNDESDEWMRSPEGQQIMQELTAGGGKSLFEQMKRHGFHGPS